MNCGEGKKMSVSEKKTFELKNTKNCIMHYVLSLTSGNVMPTPQRNVLPSSSGQTFGTVCSSETSVITQQPSRCNKSDDGSVNLHHRENINLRNVKWNLNAALCRNMDPIIIYEHKYDSTYQPLLTDKNLNSRAEITQFVQWIDMDYLHFRASIFGRNWDTISCCHIRTRSTLRYHLVLWSVGALPSSAQRAKHKDISPSHLMLWSLYLIAFPRDI